MALKEYTNFLSTNKVLSTSSNKNAEMVKRVGTKIANGIKTYYDSKGQTSILEGYKWEFNLVENNDVNAWCMPGGKVVVYTGLLPITKNENALAIVLGHEIAHAVAQHGSERMSQGLLQQLGGTALQVALSSKPVETQNLYLAAYGIEVLLEPFYRFPEKKKMRQTNMDFTLLQWLDMTQMKRSPFWQRMASTGSSKPRNF